MFDSDACLRPFAIGFLLRVGQWLVAVSSLVNMAFVVALFQGLFRFFAAVSTIRINVRVGFCRNEQPIKKVTVKT